jgi:hypothetical protein
MALDDSETLGGWASQMYELPAQDALMALDRDLMIADGMPVGSAEQLAVQHARERINAATEHDDPEAG